MQAFDIFEVIQKVVTVFEKHGISYHVGGSLASSSFGVARTTLDADLAANIKLEQAAIISDALKNEFYADEAMIRKAIQHRSSFNLIHLDTMFKVDVFVLKDRRFDQVAFNRRFQKPFSESEPTQFFFSTPEDIILHKLEWYKSGGGVSDRQWNDVLGVLKVQGLRLDISYLKEWAEELNLSKLLKNAFDDAGLHD